MKNKQKLIVSILEHNSNVIQAQNVFAENHSVTRKTNDKSISHTTGNNVFRNDKKNKSNIPKDDRFKELQVSFKDVHPEAHQPKVKKNIVVIRDSTSMEGMCLVVIQLRFDLILRHQQRT